MCHELSLCCCVDVDIQQCVTDAVKLYQITPASLCVRRYEHTSCQHSDVRPEVVGELHVAHCLVNDFTHTAKRGSPPANTQNGVVSSNIGSRSDHAVQDDITCSLLC